MKKTLKNIGEYFKRVFKAILNITPEPKTLEKIGFPRKRSFNDFDIETIRKIIELTKHNDFDENKGVKLLIENGKKINEYKKWYTKLVGYNKPTGELKKMIEDDAMVDRIELDRKFRKFLIEDSKKKVDEPKNPTIHKVKSITNTEGNNINNALPDAIKNLMANNSINIPSAKSNRKNKIDLDELLKINKENLDRIK